MRPQRRREAGLAEATPIDMAYPAAPTHCTSRSAPPIAMDLRADDYRDTGIPLASPPIDQAVPKLARA